MAKILVWHFTALEKKSVGGVEAVLRFLSQSMEKLGLSVGFGTHLPMEWQQIPKLNTNIFIHCHGSPMPWLKFLWMRFFLPMCCKAPIFWIYVAHGTSLGRAKACGELLRPGTWRAVFREFLICNLSHGCVAVSARAAEEVRTFYRFKPIPMVVIPNGVEPVIFQYKIPEKNNPRVAFVGRHGDVVKNFAMLVKAMEIVKQQIPDVQLVAVPGDASLAEKGIHFTGPLFGEELVKALSDCSLLVLPSLYEGDPLVLREAMATGLAIVASDIASIRLTTELYPRKELVPVGDASALAAAIVRQLKIQSVSCDWPSRTWDDVAKDYYDFYQRLKEA